MEDNRVKVSLYDSENKKLIGVFDSISCCCKYIYSHLACDTLNKKISMARRRKNIIKHNGYSYAIRSANDMQNKMLGDNQYIISEGYREPIESQMIGFNATRHSLNNQAMEKLNSYRNEKSRIKNNL